MTFNARPDKISDFQCKSPNIYVQQTWSLS